MLTTVVFDVGETLVDEIRTAAREPADQRLPLRPQVSP